MSLEGVGMICTSDTSTVESQEASCEYDTLQKCAKKGKKTQRVNDDLKSSGSHSGGNSPDLLALQ